MAERPREYPRPDATLPPFADMANAGMEAVLRRLDSSSGEGRDIALRQVAELQACVDARCEATGLRDPLSEAVSGKLEKFLAASAGDEFDVTPDMIRAATPAPMPSAVSGGSRLETVVSANLPERRAALADIAADPAVYALLPEHLREDRAIALAAVEGNAENFDKVPVELAKDTGFRSEAMRANPLVARRWSYYEHAGAREVNLVFSQAERTPSLLAGIRPEIIVQFLVQRSAQVRAEHFSVLPDWHLSVVIKKLLELDPAKTSFGPPESPVLLSKVVEDMRPQVLFDIKRGAWYAKSPRDDAKLAESARYAASLFRDPRVFEGAPDIFPETIRDAVPSALWADPVYVRHLIDALGIDAFPPALLSVEVRATLGLPTVFEGSSIGELAWVRTLDDLLSAPNLLFALENDPSLVRAMPLATQNDGPFMARLVERIPAIASGRFLSAVALAHPDVIRACHAALGSEAGTDGVPLDYEGLTVGDMRALEADYGKKATLDLRFLERIESGMSQGRRDAAEWRSLYRDIYAQERDIMGQMRSMRYRSERMVRGRGGDFRELLLDEKAWSRFARDELKDELSGLDADTLQFLSKHREDIHGLLSHLGNSDNDTGGLYWYVSALGEKIKDNPGLAGKLQALLVRLNAAYHEKKIREIAGESSRRLSESLDLGSRASGFLERFMSDEKITDPDIAKWSGTPSATTKSVAAGVATKTPEYAKERKTWAGLCGLFEGRVQKHLLAHPAAPGERPGAVFERALDAAFADTGDLDPQTVASLRRAVTEEYWHRYGQTMLASPVMTDAMTGRVTREEFVRRAETVADLATRHYAAGLSAEESLAAIASPEYLSAARALAPQVSAAPAAGTSSLGYPVAADGSLVVESALRGAAYSLDPVTGRISSPEGLSLSVRPDADRESVERAVSSLDFLRESGMSFLGSDVERVFALAHSLDPASSLTPEDGLDESERRLLLSALLPFFGVELPEGAIYTDMTAALDRLNRGTSDRESGLLLRLAGQGAPYIDSDTLAFDFRRFETAFVARSREKQERFDSPAVSI